MKKQCSGCGINIDDNGDKYQYCDKCEIERLDPNIKPRAVEYIGGVIGCLPNYRGTTEFHLKRNDWQYVQHMGSVPVYTRTVEPRDPSGNIALITLDDCIVIVNGKFELESLLTDHQTFIDEPILRNLPGRISSLTPEHHDIMLDAKRKAGLID